MATRKLVLEFEFEEEIEDDWVHLQPIKVTRTHSDPEIDINGLGEEIAQSDRWQVDNWIAIQQVLGNSDTTEADLK